MISQEALFRIQTL